MPPSIPPLKRLEIAWRRGWIRALTAILRRGSPPPPADWDSRPHRVLFLRHDRIGDMILSTGLLRAIATSHRTITLDVLASPANAPILRGNPHVQRVVLFDRTKPFGYVAAMRRLRAARYDAVIDCMPTAPSLTTMLLMMASGAPHRIGVAGRGNDDAFTLLVPPLADARHIVDHLAALAAAFGIAPRTVDFRPTLALEPAERADANDVWRGDGSPTGRRLLVNISAGRSFRRWPDDRFVATIRHARATDRTLDVIVIAAPNEQERATAIARDADVRHVATPSLRRALALVATADLVVTPDTGLAHAAAAFDRPAVVMYVHGTAAGWGLYKARGYEISSPDGSLLSLELSPVLQALDSLLAQRSPPDAGDKMSDRNGPFVRSDT